MKWSEFNESVRTFLLVDSERKGRGIQKYIDKQIIAGALDLQQYVSQLQSSNINTFFANEMLPVPSGTRSSEVEFVPTHAKINSVIISGLESDESTRWYSYVQIVPWSNRFSVINGCPLRTKSYAGKITFGDGKLYLCSPLVDDEKLYVYWSGEKRIYDVDDIVIFDDSCAKAVADFVKAHLNREVDKDVAMYKSYMEMYNKQRQQIHVNWKDYNVTNSIDHVSGGTSGNGIGNFTIK